MQRRTHPNLPGTGGACLVLLASLTACDLSPRTPEEPAGSGRLVSLTDPDSVLLQIQIGVTSGRINSYMNAFDQTFLFHPDERDSSTVIQQFGQGWFDNWIYSVEQSAMQLVFRQYSPRTVSFTEAQSPQEGTDIFVLYENYDLTVGDETYQGLAELQMRRTGNDWRIYLWIDRRQASSQLNSWTLLKGNNRTNP
jgi:hypothetical protein